MVEQEKISFGTDQIVSFAERIRTEKAAREKRQLNRLSFGISFFDDALNGIQNDLVLVGASSGVGKTELSTHIATTNAGKGKRVHFFALEAEPNEIEQRIKYKYLAQMMFRGLIPKPIPGKTIDYADWYDGKYNAAWGPYEAEADAFLAATYPTLFTMYREFGTFTADDFARQLLAIQDETDLVIIDHFHYFDFEDQNENRAMKETVKKIRDIALLTQKPIVLVAHVRKKDSRSRQLIPGLEDFHGTSDIGKIGTKAIMLSPCHSVDLNDKTRFPTFMRAVKYRQGSHRTRNLAVCNFSVEANAYENNYHLGTIGHDERGGEIWHPIEDQREIPGWATRAKTFVAPHPHYSRK